MKKIYYITFYILFIAASFMTLGCKGLSMEKSHGGMDADTLVTAPTYVYSTKQDSTIECSYEVDYPKQSDSLSFGIKKFIAQKLSDIYLPYNSEESSLKDYPLYNGNIQKCNDLVNFYAEGTKCYLISQQKEMMKERLEKDWIPRFQIDVKIKKRMETSTYITYSVAYNVTLGGAHGSYYYSESSINKNTACPLTQTVDTTKVLQIQPLLRKGILGYLKSNGIENVESDYKNYLFLPDDGHFPLPVHLASLTNEGVKFFYQQYEIASYAVGVVSFTIPYDAILPFLCREAKTLVENE